MTKCPEELVRAYRDPTSIDSRTVLLEVYQRILIDKSHLYTTPFDEIWDWFTKTGVTDLKQPLVMTKPGLIPANYPVLLQQGHSYAPMYTPHAKTQHWTAYNPFRVEVRTSKNGRERMEFVTEQQIGIAAEADAIGFATGISEWKKMVIILLFRDKDYYKKYGSTKSDGSDGICAELYKAYFEKDADEGIPSYQQGQSIEQNYLCYNETDKTFTRCKKDSECKRYVVKEDVNEQALTAIRKCLEMNTGTLTTTDLAGFTDSGFGSAEYAKYIGMLHGLQEEIAEMTYGNTSKFNVGLNATDLTKCGTEEASTLLTKFGRNIGCCKKCLEAKKDSCCCYNQNHANVEDLALFVHFKDFLEIQKGFPLMSRPQGLQNFSAYLGGVKVFVNDFIEQGKPRIINRKTIGIHPVPDAGLIVAPYPELEMTNMKIVMCWHIVLYPFAARMLTKAT